MAQQQMVTKDLPHKGLIELMTTRIETIPALTIGFFVLLFLAGLTKILPADLVNNVLKYVGSIY